MNNTPCEALDAQIIDDGTLDTVVACKNCTWKTRYSADSVVGELLLDPTTEAEAYEACAEDHWMDQH